MTRTARFLTPIVIATLLGPFAAGLAFCLLMLATAVSDGIGGLSLADFFRMSTVFMMFAYYEGAKIAFVGGLLLALWVVRRPPTFIAAIAAAIGAVLLFRVAGWLGVLDPIDASALRNNFVLYLLIAIFAATVCWAVTYRWVTRL